MRGQANYMTAAVDKVADAVGAFNGKEVLDRIRESEHATEADIIAFAETFLSGRYREKEPGASFARIFERMLREGGDVIRQEPLPVEPRETLTERIHAIEHRLLPEVVRELCAH